MAEPWSQGHPVSQAEREESSQRKSNVCVLVTHVDAQVGCQEADSIRTHRSTLETLNPQCLNHPDDLYDACVSPFVLL